MKYVDITLNVFPLPKGEWSYEIVESIGGFKERIYKSSSDFSSHALAELTAKVMVDTGEYKKFYFETRMLGNP